MMAGELVGVAVVATSAAIGVATFMLKYPTAFTVFKYAGGAYLAWLGIQMWRSRGKMRCRNPRMKRQRRPLAASSPRRVS